MKILISHPGFSNFHYFFKEQAEQEIFLHRNFDLNSTIFRICRLFKLLKVLEIFNTLQLIKMYKKNKVDRVIIIKGCTIDYDLLGKYSVDYTIYVWDSIENIYNGGRYINIPSLVLTFDLKDALQYKFKYLPLFHFRGTEFVEKAKITREIISMYGTYSFERALILDLLNSRNLINIPIEHHLTISISHFFREFFLMRRPFRILWKYSTFKKLHRSKIEDLLYRSLATLDIVNERQSGMTTRTIESLSYRTKLITNNITTFNFCKDNNLIIFFLDTKTMKFDKQKLIEFLSLDLQINEDFLKSYSIDSFINNIINHNQ
jgi:hypothetical protein